MEAFYKNVTACVKEVDEGLRLQGSVRQGCVMSPPGCSICLWIEFNKH